MGKFLLIVSSEAKEGRDADYAEWYEKIHLDEVLAVPGVVSARLYKAHESSPADAGPPFWGIFELETEDPKAVLAEIRRRVIDGETPLPDSIDVMTAKNWVFSPIA